MRYFIAYHNEQKTGVPCTSLAYPRVRTKKAVVGLEGSIVWLIAGVGKKSPKHYFIASRFVILKCETDKYIGEKQPNEASGTGRLMGLTIPIDGTALLDSLRLKSANFVSGFCEIQEPSTIAALKALT